MSTISATSCIFEAKIMLELFHSFTAITNSKYVSKYVGLGDFSKVYSNVQGTTQTEAINCILTQTNLVITAAGNVIRAWKRGKQVLCYMAIYCIWRKYISHGLKCK